MKIGRINSLILSYRLFLYQIIFIFTVTFLTNKYNDIFTNKYNDRNRESNLQ